MKKTSLAFTLVELIVVITILAILGTIAFISLQGYSQNAKNSKTSSDIRTLISAIETASTESNNFNITDLVTDSWSHGTAVSVWSFWSWVNIASGSYSVGRINFPFIRQWETDFQDSEWNDYIAALIYEIAKPDNQFYQIIWQTKNQWGTYEPIVKGSYLKISPWDIDGLVAAPWYPNWINSDSIWIPSPGIY
jgi:prepilin-type N-terminal cleavage/methylation domain-containing protein